MHMYSNASNARAAARKLVAQYPELIIDSVSVRAPSVTPMFYAAVTWLPKANPTVEEKTAIEEKAKVYTAEEYEQVEREDAEDAKAHAANVAGRKAPAKKAKAKKAPAKKAPAKKASGPKPKKEGKGAKALAMMSRANGATGEELQKALEWLPHTVRGFVSNENRLNGRGIETVRESGKPTRYVIK